MKLLGVEVHLPSAVLHRAGFRPVVPPCSHSTVAETEGGVHCAQCGAPVR